jgi:hypothetical protein
MSTKTITNFAETILGVAVLILAPLVMLNCWNYISWQLPLVSEWCWRTGPWRPDWAKGNQMLNFSIFDIPNGYWPVLLCALDGGILVFLALWGLLTACFGNPTNKKEGANPKPDVVRSSGK